MISFTDLIDLAFLGVFAYGVYLFKQAIDLFRAGNFTNYKSYKEAVKEGEKRIWKPIRSQDEVGIHRIKGDKTKVTMKDSNGIAHTHDAYVDIVDADPDVIMKSIDREFPETEVKDNG